MCFYIDLCLNDHTANQGPAQERYSQSIQHVGGTGVQQGPAVNLSLRPPQLANMRNLMTLSKSDTGRRLIE